MTVGGVVKRLSGQHSDYWQTNGPINNSITGITTATGKTPAIVGVAYNLSGSLQNGIADAIKYQNAGNIVQVNWWAGNPNDGVSAVNQSSTTGPLSAMGTTGSTGFNNLMSMVDAMCVGLKTIPNQFIFRPFLEMDGNWFWWGEGNINGSSSQGMSDAQFIVMWQAVFNRVCVTNGVTNALFHWCSNGGGFSRWPGDSFVHLSGWDGYPPGIPGSVYSSLAPKSPTIPILLGEIGIALEPTSHFNGAGYDVLTKGLYSPGPNLIGEVIWCQTNQADLQNGLSAYMADHLTLADLPAFTVSGTTPAQVQNLSAIVSGSNVTLTWSAATNASSYEVFQNNSLSISNVFATNVTFNVVPQQTVQYSVAGVNGSNVGPQSNTVNVFTGIVLTSSIGTTNVSIPAANITINAASNTVIANSANLFFNVPTITTPNGAVTFGIMDLLFDIASVIIPESQAMIGNNVPQGTANAGGTAFDYPATNVTVQIPSINVGIHSNNQTVQINAAGISLALLSNPLSSNGAIQLGIQQLAALISPFIIPVAQTVANIPSSNGSGNTTNTGNVPSYAIPTVWQTVQTTTNTASITVNAGSTLLVTLRDGNASGSRGVLNDNVNGIYTADANVSLTLDGDNCFLFRFSNTVGGTIQLTYSLGGSRFAVSEVANLASSNVLDAVVSNYYASTAVLSDTITRQLTQNGEFLFMTVHSGADTNTFTQTEANTMTLAANGATALKIMSAYGVTSNGVFGGSNVGSSVIYTTGAFGSAQERIIILSAYRAALNTSNTSGNTGNSGNGNTGNIILTADTVPPATPTGLTFTATNNSVTGTFIPTSDLVVPGQITSNNKDFGVYKGGSLLTRIVATSNTYFPLTAYIVGPNTNIIANTSQINGVISLTASGQDYYNNVDYGVFLANTITGNFFMQAVVTNCFSTYEFSKIGLDVRNGLTGTDVHGDLPIFPPSIGAGYQFAYRSVAGSNTNFTGATSNTATPIGIAIARQGNNLLGLVSTTVINNAPTNWTVIANQALPLNATVYAGIFGSAVDVSQVGSLVSGNVIQFSITQGANVTFTDNTVSNSTTYNYELTARDTALNESKLSGPVSITTSGGTIPSGIFGIKNINGNLFSTASNTQVFIVGMMTAGTETINSTQRYLAWGGLQSSDYNNAVNKWAATNPPYSAINCFRVNIHSGAWMGYKGRAPFAANLMGYFTPTGTNGPSGQPLYNADPQGNYKTTMVQVINRILAAGYYVNINLMFGSPTLVSTGEIVLSVGQCAMPGPADVAFWTDVANTFGYPNGVHANLGVMFELYNEPFGTSGGSNFAGDMLYDAGILGGTANVAYPGGSNPAGLNGGYKMLVNTGNNSPTPICGGNQQCYATGHQAMLNAIRATGAQNMCWAGPPNYSGEMEYWLNMGLTDPLHQLGASFHAYGYAQGSQNFKNVQATGIPFMCTEMGSLNSDGDSYAEYRSHGWGYEWMEGINDGWASWSNPSTATLAQNMINNAPWGHGAVSPSLPNQT